MLQEEVYNYILSRIRRNDVVNYDIVIAAVLQFDTIFRNEVEKKIEKSAAYITLQYIFEINPDKIKQDGFGLSTINFWFMHRFVIEKGWMPDSPIQFSFKHVDLLKKILHRNERPVVIRSLTDRLRFLSISENTDPEALRKVENNIACLLNEMKQEQSEQLYFPKSIEVYRKSCEFSITSLNVQGIKGYDLLCRHGWYDPVYNIFGVVKDHRFSVFEGFTRRISPSIIGHVKNCELMTVRKNCSKGALCSIDIHDLISEIKQIDICEPNEPNEPND